MTHAITPTDRRVTPRCCECALPLHRIVEPFSGGVAQHYQCEGCGVHLHVRRVGAAWTVCTAAQRAGQRTSPLPALASTTLRRSFLAACIGVAAMLRAEGVEPGMATVLEERGNG